MVDLLKTTLLPGSAWFLLVVVAFGVLLLYVPRAWRWGRRALMAAIVLYVVISTPVVARLLEAGLDPGYVPITNPADVAAMRAIVLLGSGTRTVHGRDSQVDTLTTQSQLSVLEAARLARLAPDAVVVTSGGRPDPRLQATPESRVLKDGLVRQGIAADRIVEETTSANTYEQAVNLRPFLQARGLEPFVLVASRTHMRRALAMFQRQGMSPLVSPSPLEQDFSEDARSWIPGESGLDSSHAASYHYLAIVYAMLKGWVSPTDLWRAAPAS